MLRSALIIVPIATGIGAFAAAQTTTRVSVDSSGAQGNNYSGTYGDAISADGRYVAFGSGVHACLGQMFARLEGEAILTAFAERVHRFELVGEPEPSLNNTSRGYASIPLKVARE